MSDDTIRDTGTTPEPGDKKGYFDRRDIIKGLATLPVIGFFFVKLQKKYGMVAAEKERQAAFLKEIGLGEAPASLPSGSVSASGKQLRVGFIGYGSRGEYVMRAAGFAHPEWLENMKTAAETNKNDKRLEDFLKQDDLNIVINGVCDAYSVRAENGLDAASKGANTGKQNKDAKIYRNYRQMMESPDIDAVIVCAPEFWHAPMAVEAARNGKHIYLEKPLCLTIPEIYEVRQAVKDSGIKFQLGHQSRQTDAYIMAREVVRQNVLGKISLVTLTTNRNDPNGAWVYRIPPEADFSNVDWRMFRGRTQNAPSAQRLVRFFRWRLWYDYGTGLSGDLLTHEYDAVNMMLDLGIPKSAVATGGIYYYKDGREVPDVYNVVYEYPDRELTLKYSATLENSTKRGKLVMGSDATMSFGQLHASSLAVTADSGSEKYKKYLDAGLIDAETPMFSYSPGSKGFDAVTTATEKYFAGRGLLYTYRDGKRVDTTHLHIAEWLDAIRTNGDTSCNIDRGFEEAVTAHMGTLAYKIGRRVEWDEINEVISNAPIPENWTDEEIQRILSGGQTASG